MGHALHPSPYLRTWAHLLDGGRILDVPGGEGRNAHWLAALGKNVVCVDIDRDKINLALVHASNDQGWIGGVFADANCCMPFEAETFKGAIITPLICGF